MDCKMSPFFVGDEINSIYYKVAAAVATAATAEKGRDRDNSDCSFIFILNWAKHVGAAFSPICLQ